jgi:hypothetical protein
MAGGRGRCVHDPTREEEYPGAPTPPVITSRCWIWLWRRFQRRLAEIGRCWRGGHRRGQPQVRQSAAQTRGPLLDRVQPLAERSARAPQHPLEEWVPALHGDETERPGGQVCELKWPTDPVTLPSRRRCDCSSRCNSSRRPRTMRATTAAILRAAAWTRFVGLAGGGPPVEVVTRRYL